MEGGFVAPNPPTSHHYFNQKAPERPLPEIYYVSEGIINRAYGE